MHPALAHQLTHAGVDDRVAGPPLLPRLEVRRAAHDGPRQPVVGRVIGKLEVPEHLAMVAAVANLEARVPPERTDADDEHGLHG